MSTWKARALTAGRLVMDVAPVIIALSRASHPIAWISAAIYVAKKAHDSIGSGASEPNLWPGLSFNQRHAILYAAHLAGAGEVTEQLDGGTCRVLDGVHFGAGSGFVYGPWARQRHAAGKVFVVTDWLWNRFGRSMLLYRDENEDLVLVPDPDREPQEPTALARSIAADQVLLQRAGARVGLLIDGPPGTGKSQALLHVAAELGGHSLRASFKTVSPGDLVAIASVMKPSSVVLDDIDRGPTDGALDAVEQLLAGGVSVLASANARPEICEALLRDGRIDDHRTFGVVEHDALERLAAGLEPEVVERLRGCTVAAVARYVDRRRALGPEKALAMLRPLVVDGPPPAA